jgi:YggT family protein
VSNTRSPSVSSGQPGNRGFALASQNSRLMGVAATSVLLARTAASWAQSFVDVFIYVYILLIFAYILTSWFRLPYNLWLSRIQRFLYDVCDPYLRLFRRVIPPLGPVDLSPMLAVFVLYLIKLLLDALIGRLD